MNQILKIAKHNIRMFFIRPWAILLLFVPIGLSLCAQMLFGNEQNMLLGKIGFYTTDASGITQVVRQELERAQVESVTYEDEAMLKEALIKKDIDLGVVMTYDNSYKTFKNHQMPYKLVVVGEETNQLKSILHSKLIQLTQLIHVSKDEAEFNVLYETVQQQKPTLRAENEMQKVMTMTISFGFFGMMFLLTAGIGFSPMMRERELCVYERMNVAPLRKYQYVLGHVLGAFSILFAQLLIQLIGMKCFKIDFNLDSIEFLLIGIALGIVAISVSLFVLSISKKSTVYHLIMGIGVTPLCMLSGLFLPIELLPMWLQKVAYLSPVRWVMQGYTQMIQNKALIDVVSSLVVAILIASVLILISLSITSSYQEQE
ncbi:MAG: ABC transporter permease [Cellulosilyticaceae bacterium]